MSKSKYSGSSAKSKGGFKPLLAIGVVIALVVGGFILWGSVFKDDTPANGKSAYELAMDNGFEGTEKQWLDSLRGNNGLQGVKGDDGVDGVDFVANMYIWDSRERADEFPSILNSNGTFNHVNNTIDAMSFYDSLPSKPTTDGIMTIYVLNNYAANGGGLTPGRVSINGSGDVQKIEAPVVNGSVSMATVYRYGATPSVTSSFSIGVTEANISMVLLVKFEGCTL